MTNESERFEFDVKRMPEHVVVLVVRGSLTEQSRTEFFESIGTLIEEGFEKIIIDCEGLGFISSAGLAGLVVAKQQAQRKGGKIYLTHVNATVADVLRITKLNALLGIFPTTRELLESLGRIRHHPDSRKKGLNY